MLQFREADDRRPRFFVPAPGPRRPQRPQSPMLEHTHPDTPARARALLSSYTLGVLLSDEAPTPVRYTIEPTTGRLIMDADRDILEASEHVLMIPEESFTPPLSLMIELAATDSEAFHDRHRAYHGDSPLPRYAIADILSAKLDSSEVIEGDLLQRPNPLAPAISRLGRMLNADRSILSSICEHLTGARPDEPTAVGVDPFGFDVRARFGVIRARFDATCPTEPEARAKIESLIERCR